MARPVVLSAAPAVGLAARDGWSAASPTMATSCAGAWSSSAGDPVASRRDRRGGAGLRAARLQLVGAPAHPGLAARCAGHGRRPRAGGAGREGAPRRRAGARADTMKDVARPLVLHLVHRFDVGGLENGW